MTIAEQLGNVGGEVHRLVSWRERGRPEQSEKAFVRMLELLDLTLADTRWHGLRAKEVARAREALCADFENNASSTAWESWKRYFDAFGFAARIGK